MKTVKRGMVIALGLAMAMAACLPGMAQQSEPEKMPRLDTSYTAEELMRGDMAIPTAQDVARPARLPDNVPVYGNVTVLEDGRLHIKTESTTAVVSEMVMAIREDTYILDAVTGETRSAEDIRDGDFIYAYADPIMALSMPPQGGAQLILVGVPAGFMAPSYHTVMTVNFDGENEVATIVTDKNATFALDSGVQIMPHLTFNNVTADQLIPGQRILVWETMTREADADTAAEYAVSKVLVFAYGFAGWLEVNDDSVMLSGQAIEGAAAYINDDGLVMLPMRAVCEALGLQVEWDGDAWAAIAIDGDKTYTFPIGGNQALIGEDNTAYLYSAVLLVEAKTMLSALDIANLFNLYYPMY